MKAGAEHSDEISLRLVYDELRRVAARYMRRERGNHTLQPTALVHEAYARLHANGSMHWQSRAHFLAVAARQMRRILVDHALARKAIDVLALHEALERLANLDSRQGRIVELHFFGGSSFEEIAQVLDVSERTVKRDWSMARAWLHHELTKSNDAGTVESSQDAL